jgi:hypothetical protein
MGGGAYWGFWRVRTSLMSFSEESSLQLKKGMTIF